MGHGIRQLTSRPPATIAATRRSALATLALGCLLPAFAVAQVRDFLGIPGPLSFDGTSYDLSWSARPSPAYTKQEYLPAGQAKDSYASMLMVEVVAGGTTVDAALGAQVRMLNARKGSDPLVNFAVIRNPQTGEAVLDFLIGGRTPQGAAIAEWNAYRYAPRKIGGRDGVMLLALSRRAYGDVAVRTFLGTLKTERPGMIERLTRQPLPTPRL